MAAAGSLVYVLSLEGGRFYVGESQDPYRQFDEHRLGRGGAWTRLHAPLSLDQVAASAPSLPERVTKQLMLKHGIDKVRGGAYTDVILQEAQRKVLERDLLAAARVGVIHIDLRDIRAHSESALTCRVRRPVSRQSRRKRKRRTSESSRRFHVEGG